MRGLKLALVAVLLGLQYPLWVAHGGWWTVLQLHGQLAQREVELAQLQTRNAKLLAQVDDLESGTGAIEELARRNLGMVGRGELFVWVVPKRGAAPAEPSALPQAPDAKA